MDIASFQLDFSSGSYAAFPFIVHGDTFEGLECRLSSRQAGSLAYDNGESSPERDAFFRSLGTDPREVYACAQIHSRRVFLAERGMGNFLGEGDGMVAADYGLTLAVVVADCLPIFLWDTRKREAASHGGPFALVHSGWKGTGIVLEALTLMEQRWGSRMQDVAAVFGPCIRGCCYRVDEARALRFEAEWGGAGGDLGPVIRREDSGFYLDLQAANARLLARAGVMSLAVCENCTFTDERLGSFRREGPNYTRMAAALGVFPPAGT